MTATPDDSDWTEDQILRWVSERESGLPVDSSVPEPPPELAPRLNRLLRGVRLLQQSGSNQDFDVELTRALDGLPSSEQRPASIFSPRFSSRYQLQKRLGQGGFGVVYLARDRQLERDVAVKVPRPDIILTRELLQRFHREAQNAATLHHPNIVAVYATETAHPLPALVYHYCRGPSLARWLKSRTSPVPPRLAAEVLRLLAEAVHHAHSRGILHRDLKPGNVLLDAGDDQAAGRGFRDGDQVWIPRVADFGISKAIDDDQEGTRTGAVLGTPEYMAPEQAGGRTGEIGTHSDIFALGVILYEMLAGRPPFRGNSTAETQVQVQTCEPPPLRHFRPNAPRDLEAIAGKCLQRDYSLRYQSAAALSEDLQRFLDGRSVSAQTEAWLPRTVRWCRRNPVVTSLYAGLAFLAIGLIGSLAWNAYEASVHERQLMSHNSELSRALAAAEEQRQLALKNESRALQMLYVSDLQLAAKSWRMGDVGAAARTLAGQPAELRNRVTREFGGRYLHRQVAPPNQLIASVDQTIWFLAFAPNGEKLAVAGNRGDVQLLTVKSGFRVARTLQTGHVEVNSIAFSPDSRLLASAGDDGRVGLWDVATGELVRFLDGFPGKPVFGVAFLDQGRQVVACGKSPQLVFWDTASGRLLERWTTVHPTVVEAVCASADGNYFATGGAEGQAAIYRRGGKEAELVLSGHRGAVASLRFSRDGRSLFTGGADGSVRVHQLTSRESQLLLTRDDGISAVDASSADEVAVCDRAGGIAVLAPETAPVGGVTANGTYPKWRVRQLWSGHDKRIHGLAFSPLGDVIVSGDSEGKLRLWNQIEISQHRVIAPSAPSTSPLSRSVCLGADSNTLFRAGSWGLERWNLDRPEPELLLPPAATPQACAYIPLTQTVVVVNSLGQIGWIPLANPGEPKWLDVFPGTEAGDVLTFDQGRRVIARNRNNEMAIVQSETRTVLKRIPKRSSFDASPDGRWIATGEHGTNDLVVYDARTLEMVARRPAHQSTLERLEFTSDGRRLLTASHDRTAKVWDVATWQPQLELLGHRGKLTDVTCTPDGHTIATSDHVGFVKLWYAATGQELFELQPLDGAVLSLHFSSDGARLFAVEDGLALHVFVAPRLGTAGESRSASD